MRKYLDLSTAHLSCDTRNCLDGAAFDPSVIWSPPPGWPAMTIAIYEYGWFVSVPPLDTQDIRQQADNLPPDLLDVLLYAYKHGAEIVRFDADGDELTTLPTFEP